MPQKPKEQTEAELAAKLMESVGTLSESVPKMQDQIKGLSEQIEVLNGIEPEKVVERMEKLDAGLDQIRKAIRRNQSHGLFLSGLEDDQEKAFSLVRAMSAVKMGGTQQHFERCNAGFEYEVMSQIREKAQKSGHVVGVDSAGGFFVPDQVIPDVIQAIYTRSVLIDLAGDGQTRVSILDGLTGTPARIPKFEGGVIAYWIGEEDEYAESQARFGGVTMTPKKLGILTKITDEMRRFSSLGAEQLMRRDMVRALAKKMDWTVLYGPGTDNAPRGVANMPGIQVYRAENQNTYPDVASARTDGTWNGGQFTFDDFDNMRGVLEDSDIDIDEPGSFASISAPRLFRKVRQLKIDSYSGQTENQAYLLGAPMIRESTLRDLIGDFGKTTQVPTRQDPGQSINVDASADTDRHGDVFSANWSEVVVGRWSGIEIEDDDGRGVGFTKDETLIKMRMYADVGHRQEKAIVVCPDAEMFPAP